MSLSALNRGAGSRNHIVATRGRMSIFGKPCRHYKLGPRSWVRILSPQPLGVCPLPLGKAPDGSLCYVNHRPDEAATGQSLHPSLTGQVQYVLNSVFEPSYGLSRAERSAFEAMPLETCPRRRVRFIAEAKWPNVAPQPSVSTPNGLIWYRRGAAGRSFHPSQA